MDRGAWWATVHGVTKSWTRLSDFTFTFNSCLNKVYIPNGTGASSISRLPSAVILLKLKFPALFKYFPSLLMQKPILILVPKFLYDLCPSSSLSAGLHFPLTHSAPQRLTFCFCVQCPRPKFRAFSSVAQFCPTLCDPMNFSTPGLPVHQQLPEFTQTYVH